MKFILFYFESLIENTVLYADWTTDKRTVTFNSDGGTTINNVVVDYARRAPRIGDFQKSIKSGKAFLGWYTKKDGEGTQYSYIKNFTTNITLYAYWEDYDSRAESNYIHNIQVERTFITFSKDGYIISQAATEPFNYGDNNSKDTGCGWIATYNTLRTLTIKGLLDRQISIADIIRYYEYNGIINNATWGTQPWAIQDYLQTQGFDVDIHYITDNFAEKVQNADSSIMLDIYVWGGHYRSIDYRDGEFHFYNTGDKTSTSFGAEAWNEQPSLYTLITINAK